MTRLLTEGLRAARVVLVIAKGITPKSEALTAPRLQFWTDRCPPSREVSSDGQPSSSGSSDPSTPAVAASKDMTADYLEEYKNRLDCSRLFIYSGTPKSALHVMFGAMLLPFILVANDGLVAYIEI